MPDVLLIAAQILIGSALGAQFRPAFLTRLFRLLWASCLVVLFAAGASHLGWMEGRMPDVLLIAAQILIGSALGAQFRPAFLTRLFRLLWASCVVVLFAAGSMALFAAAIAWLAGYPVPTMVLAMAPAGIAEMVLTGKVLGLDSTLIAGFQLMRIIIVLIWCRTALVLFQRAAERVFGKPPEPPSS